MSSTWIIAALFGLGAVTTNVASNDTMLHTRRPPRIRSVWNGLPHPVERAPAAGVVALRPPLDRRVRISGGRFVMGSTPQEMQDAMQLCAKEALGIVCARIEHTWDVANAVRAEGHAHEVTLSDFEIDVTEVTVEKYARCVAASGCSPPSFPPGDPRYDVPSYPVTHVLWQDAANYCTWAGARLPTEAEWELAARGKINNAFPWGNIYSPRLCNHGAFADDPSDARDGFVGLAPVGSFPDGATPTGLLDMAGNASEWVADWYERDEQQFGYKRGAATNPKGPPFGALGHVIRGGSYRDGAHWQRSASRRASGWAEREVGFRCAADVK
jgi:formylglycine-generating enzyme